MATSVTENLIHVFIARLDLEWRAILSRHYCDSRFWRAVEDAMHGHSENCNLINDKIDCILLNVVLDSFCLKYFYRSLGIY